MGRFFTAAAIVVFLTAACSAADLTKIDRTIGKLPELKSPAPEYALLVFGSEAATRVWLVHDGGVLYVDRNANGDLTEPDERVTADAKESNPSQGEYTFEAGDITDGKLVHKDLRISWARLDYMKETSPEVRERLLLRPEMPGCTIYVDVSLPEYTGTGIDGRVIEGTSYFDENGFLEFAATPAEAPIVRFGSVWRITGNGNLRWAIGSSRDFYLTFGTPGLGPGTTTQVQYEGIVPSEIKPQVTVTYPAVAKGQPAITKQYELGERCCTFNLYGNVAVPDDIGIGKGKIDITLPNWGDTVVASTTHEVTILPRKPGPTLVPVSARLKKKLAHQHEDGGTVAIQFSPDGKRLIAGDYPGGLVNVWDIATGERLVPIDCGEGNRGSLNYFTVSPDWRTLFVAHDGKSTFEKVERDGEQLYRTTYDGSVSVFDLETGELKHEWRDDPPRGIIALELWPDGKRFFTLDWVEGEWKTERLRALSLWDATTGEHREIARGNNYCYEISGDGHQAVFSIPDSPDESDNSALCIYALPEWKEQCRLARSSEKSRANFFTFARGGELAVGAVQENDEPKDYYHYTAALKIWDAATGAELFSMPAPERDEAFYGGAVSSDGRTLATSNWSLSHHPARVYLVDMVDHTSKMIVLGNDMSARPPIFDPTGRWVAVATQAEREGRSARDAKATDLAQPRIHIIDAREGKIVETLVSEQCFPNSLAFSPDGKTLASSGLGCVLLWDFSMPLGPEPSAPAGN